MMLLFKCKLSIKWTTLWMLLLTTLMANINTSNAANILAMFPMPFKSHFINFMPVVKELAIRGHNVTLVSVYPQKPPVPNLNEVLIPDLTHKLADLSQSPSWLDLDKPIPRLFRLWMMGLTIMPMVLELKEMKSFIANTELKFDLVLTPAGFIQEPFIAFGHKYNAPVINVIPAIMPLTTYLNGNHMPTSYVPALQEDFSDRMTFFQRVKNAFFINWDITMGQLYYLPKQEEIMRKYFNYPGSENLPPLVDMLRNTSFTLMDYHPAAGYPKPLHRNSAGYGGVHVHNGEKLPADLQKFMDNAKDGVIYFSYGSFFQITDYDAQTQNAIFTVLGKLKQKVLMKLDDPSVLQKYPHQNIEVRKWFPQAAVLAHPNCKLFITHGGYHGLMEGIYHAVPLLATPLMADQRYNAIFMQTTGIGYYLPRETITVETFSKAIDEVMNNPSYREKMNERSAIFKDQPMTPLDSAVYWIEYVIRHKGAPHLRPAVLDLHWFQALMLDVIAFYLLITVIIIFIVKRVISLFCSCIKCVIFGKKTCNKKNIKKSKKE